jgi:predicted metal-dependent hydrolase
VAQQAEWIMRALAKQAKKPRLVPLKYVTGERLFYLGKPHRLEVTHSVWKSVTRVEGVLRVSLSDTSSTARVKALVDEWFRTQAQTVLAKLLEETVKEFGSCIRHPHCPPVMRSEAHPNGLRLTVRAMKTRWGSCSKDGHITLSMELIYAPRRLIEYIIVHELCHLAHLDHSPAFYFQLAQCLPDWEERRHDLEMRVWQRVPK